MSLREHIESLWVLLEKSSHDPFQHQRKLGPGPRRRTVKKRRQDRFRCKCKGTSGGSICTCKLRKGEKKVVIDGDYKQDYNKDYKKWAKKHRKRMVRPRSFLKRVKTR